MKQEKPFFKLKNHQNQSKNFSFMGFFMSAKFGDILKMLHKQKTVQKQHIFALFRKSKHPQNQTKIN
jgi:hypothetical protein